MFRFWHFITVEPEGEGVVNRADQLALLQSQFTIALQPIPSYFEMPTAFRAVESRTVHGMPAGPSKPVALEPSDAQLERRPSRGR